MAKTLLITYRDGQTRPLTVPDDFDAQKPTVRHSFSVYSYHGVDGDTIYLNWDEIRIAYLTDKYIQTPAPEPTPDELRQAQLERDHLVEAATMGPPTPPPSDADPTVQECATDSTHSPSSSAPTGKTPTGDQ